MTAFSANMFKNPGFDTLIMRENEGLIGVAQTKEIRFLMSCSIYAMVPVCQAGLDID